MNICIDCKRCTGYCSWSREFKPVNGWEAEKVDYIDGPYKDTTYNIKKCPLFKKHIKKPIGYRIKTRDLAKMLHKCDRWVFRVSDLTITEELHKLGYTNIKCIRHKGIDDIHYNYYIVKL